MSRTPKKERSRTHLLSTSSTNRPTFMAPASPSRPGEKQKIESDGRPEGLNDLLKSIRQAYADTRTRVLIAQLGLENSTLPGSTPVAVALEWINASKQHLVVLGENAFVSVFSLVGSLCDVFARHSHPVYVDFGLSTLEQARRRAGNAVPDARPQVVDAKSTAIQATQTIAPLTLGATVDSAGIVHVSTQRLANHLLHHGFEAKQHKLLKSWQIAALDAFDVSDRPVLVSAEASALECFQLMHARMIIAVGVIDDRNRLIGHITIDAVAEIAPHNFQELLLPVKEWVGDDKALRRLLQPPSVLATDDVLQAALLCADPDNGPGVCWIVDSDQRPVGLLTATRLLQCLLADERRAVIADLHDPEFVRPRAVRKAESSFAIPRRRSTTKTLVLPSEDSFIDLRAAPLGMDDGSDDDSHDSIPSDGAGHDSDQSSDSSESSDDEPSLLTQLVEASGPGTSLLRISLIEMLRKGKPPGGVPRVVFESLAQLSQFDTSLEPVLFKRYPVSLILGLLDHFVPRRPTKGEMMRAMSSTHHDAIRSAEPGELWSLVKLYMTSLRSPLIPLNQHAYWYLVAEMESSRERLFRLHALLHALPVENQLLLQALMQTLGDMASAGYASYMMLARELADMTTRQVAYRVRHSSDASLDPLFRDLLMNHVTLIVGLATPTRLHAEAPNTRPPEMHSSSLDAATHMGVLFKGSRSFGQTRWHEKFVRIVGTSLLVFDNKDAAQASTRYELMNGTVAMLDAKNASFALKLGGKTVLLKAADSNVQEANRWIEELSNAIRTSDLAHE